MYLLIEIDRFVVRLLLLSGINSLYPDIYRCIVLFMQLSIYKYIYAEKKAAIQDYQ